MITNLTHANGKMTCTTSSGETVSRKTDRPYAAAIVGRRNRDGKLVIITASMNARTTRDEFAAVPHAAIGSRLHCKFAGYTGLELVTPDAGWAADETDPTGEKADAALLAKRK